MLPVFPCKTPSTEPPPYHAHTQNEETHIRRRTKVLRIRKNVLCESKVVASGRDGLVELSAEELVALIFGKINFCEGC